MNTLFTLRAWRHALAVVLLPLLLAACGGGGDSGAPLSGPDSRPAREAIQTLDVGDAYTEAEIETLPDGRRILRTKLKIVLRDSATVGVTNALLRELQARITSSIGGLGTLVVRIPDPGSLQALDAIVARIEREPFVWFVERAEFPATAALPPNLPNEIAGGDTRLNAATHHLAVGAAGAWNARQAALNFPRVMIFDFFGDGAPNADLEYFYDGTAASDFATGATEPHGYHVAGIIAGRFGGPDTPRGWVTGMMPARIGLSVVDLERADPLDGEMRVLLRLQAAGPAVTVLNESLGYTCYVAATCWPEDRVRLLAAWWVQAVRHLALEARVLHLVAAGNVEPPITSARDARTGATPAAAALLTDLVDANGAPLAPLTNTLVIENARPSDAPAFDGARCLSSGSFVGGHLAAIGSGVYSIADANTAVIQLSGTSMASPQVAGLAAYLLAIRPGLTPQQLVAILRNTAAPTPVLNDPSCSDWPDPAPLIQAYEALLALDEPTGTQPVRRAILDLDDNGRFDEADLAALIATWDAAAGAIDFGRADLNNDRRSGGPTRRPFDLDMDGRADAQLELVIRGQPFAFDERLLTDLAIACYYAHSPLYAGSADERDRLLQPHRERGECGAPEPEGGAVQADFPTQLPREFNRRLVVTVTGPDGQPLPGASVVVTATGGTAGSGSTDNQGRFETQARLDAVSPSLTLNVRAYGDGGGLLGSTSLTALPLPPVTVQNEYSAPLRPGEQPQFWPSHVVAPEFRQGIPLRAEGTFTATGDNGRTATWTLETGGASGRFHRLRVDAMGPPDNFNSSGYTFRLALRNDGDRPVTMDLEFVHTRGTQDLQIIEWVDEQWDQRRFLAGSYCNPLDILDCGDLGNPGRFEMQPGLNYLLHFGVGGQRTMRVDLVLSQPRQ